MIYSLVFDVGTLIDSVDQESMSKYVLTLPGPDNSMFVRISNRYRRRLGGFTSKIREFIRKPGRRSYERVEKRYIDLEILAQAAHEYIKVELFIPREDDPGEGTSSQAEGTVLGSRIWEDGGTGPRFLSTLYSIKTEMLPYFSIGVIKYGGYILEDDTENLLEKDVLWEGRAGAPRITVTALYSDGIETKTIHWFKYGTWYSYRERVSQCKVMR
ncbi:hypothetical protein BEWA_027250 [Theileria equi strain WA]|uniref:Uncharacterized protein n=1 Tax=Theileria equi strain WA TaxID=1537102 RepID=L0AXZ5_THEEQ|nr:hypothetical protein BEWA_027250 [Theileria equi strain WA]AFZ79876.1 hypothetical protein BEWA_027250 [Theileria equi strain WA]|eukprot:XP_004829542.1 hypothetical protein BEWA_027250 [Theileria equi strain WA]